MEFNAATNPVIVYRTGSKIELKGLPEQTTQDVAFVGRTWASSNCTLPVCLVHNCDAYKAARKDQPSRQQFF